MSCLEKLDQKCECGNFIYHPAEEIFDDGILTCIFCGKKYLKVTGSNRDTIHDFFKDIFGDLFDDPDYGTVI